MISHLLSLLLGALYGIHCFGRGLGSLQHCRPLIPIKLFLISSSFHQQAVLNKMFRVAAMVAVLFVHLSVLHCSSQPDHEFFSHSLDCIWVITFWILTIISVFFIQLCQSYSRLLREWLITFQFPQGKEAGGPWFG